jgi:hypothetical protein
MMRREMLGDILILTGIAMMGGGLWLLYGWQMALLFAGAILFVLGAILTLGRNA